VESLDRGGLERVVCDLVIEQVRRGHVAEVLCLFTPGAFASELTGSGIRVIAAAKTKGLDLSALRALRAASRSGQHQVVHTHNPVANYYTCAAELTSWRRLPIVNTRHNMGASNPNDRREKLFRLSVARTARVAMVSPQVSRRFISNGVVPERKAAVVMNGIPLDRYPLAGAANRTDARARLGIDSSAIVVGTVGRQVAVKNHALLLAAAAPLCRANPRLKIVLLGQGELRESLLRQAEALGISDALQLPGERADIAQLLPAFDVFAMPSRSEGHSIALLEAAAAGLPAIATAVGGNPEIVQQDETGLLVPSEDEAAFNSALARMVGDASLRENLGRQARRWAERSVSVAAMADSYERLYFEAGAIQRA
jgi:glycosyltransferase involved in cell wall biosynthesis